MEAHGHNDTWMFTAYTNQNLTKRQEWKVFCRTIRFVTNWTTAMRLSRTGAPLFTRQPI